jgi:hypothetical protein
MTLLEELLSERDYWLVPSSPSGDSSDLNKIIMVKKGANPQWMELACAQMEREMIQALMQPTPSSCP